MNDEQTDNVPYFVTCTHCGMQTGLPLKQLEGDKPLKCRACGAPFKVVPPPAKGRGEPQKKIKRDYGYYFTHPPPYDRVRDESSPDVTSVKLIAFVIVIVCCSVLFIVALISTC